MQKTAFKTAVRKVLPENTPYNRRIIKQTLLVMRLTLIMLTAAFVHVYAAGTAQSVTFSARNASLKTVFNALETQTGYFVFYNSKELEKLVADRQVSVAARNMPLGDFLSIVLKDLPLSYLLADNTITLTLLRPRSGSPQGVADNPLASISGQVLDMDGSPIAGATITVRNTRISTSADGQGRFTLNNIPATARFMVSAVGYQSAAFGTSPNSISTEPLETAPANGKVTETEDNRKSTVTATGGGSVVVRLARFIKQIEEVVITGITQRASNSFTGAARTISGAELKTISANNIFAGITALEPSFRVVANNVLGSNINQLPEIQLRGANSLPNLSGSLSGNPNLPLFILNGFEVQLQRIVDLDMNLINSVTLLKDASATAIYGSRGANGVMVVTTLAPKAGRIQVSLTNDFRYTTPDLSVYNLLDAREKLDFEQRAGLYIGTGNQDQNDKDLLYNHRLKAVESGINTDWRSFATQNGFSNRTSLFLQGGDQRFRYGMQVAADLQNGVMKGQDRKNYSGQVELQYNVNKFRFSNMVMVNQNHSNESPYGEFSKYLTMNPYWSPFDANARIKPLLEEIMLTTQRRTIANPLYDASLHSVNRSQYFGFTNNFTMRYSILPNLFVESNFSLSKQDGSTDQFYSAADSRFNAITDAAQKGSYSVRSDKSSSYESLTTANYSLTSGRHNVISTLGFNFASTNNSFYSVLTQGFPFDRLDNLLFATQYPAGSRPTGDEGTVRRLGVVYSGNYSYDNRFLADVSVRRDGSSQYGADQRFGTFWSTGIGWNLHNERMFKNNRNINTLRIRASYGSTGSLNIPAYAAQWRYTYGVNSIYFNDLGATLAGLGNEELHWQNVYKLNVGVNALLFNERLDVRADVYRENTTNTLSPVTLAPSTGFTDYSENLGEVENKGLEFGIRYKIMQNNAKGLLWSVNLNGFTNDNVLKKISNKLTAINVKQDTSSLQVRPNILLREGQSINTIYVVRSLGVDPATGSEIYLTKDGKPTYVWDAADKVPYGISVPKWSGNFGSSFSYNGFDVNLIFNYQFGGQLYNSTVSERVESVNPINNVDRRAYDLGWAKPGDKSPYTRIVAGKAATKLTSRFVQDDDNVMLSSGSLGYSFYRSALLKKLRLNSLSVRAITNDIFRVSSIQIERGTSNPFSRTYSLSIRAGF